MNELQSIMRALDNDLRPVLQTALPPDIDVQRFLSVCKTAINRNPELSGADRRSLFNACVLAAQDGLLPDGKEGTLTVYKTQVAWHPMIGGFRKLAAKYGFSLIDHAVYENDFFEYELGDAEHITHRAPPLGTPRGPIIGAYAIATDKSDGVKYHEVMDREALDQIRNCAKTDTVWSTWPGEQARKSVSRRLFKKLPFYSEPDVQRVIDHDNANYDMSRSVGKPVVAMPRAKSAPKAAVATEPVPDVEFVAALIAEETAHAD